MNQFGQTNRDKDNNKKPHATKRVTKQKHLGKHVLAAFYNDARLNILECLKDIAEKRGLKPVNEDGQILALYERLGLGSENTTIEDKKYLIEQLSNRFPFINTLTDPRGRKIESDEDFEKAKKLALPEDYYLAFKRYFELIHNLRNTMVHPMHKEVQLDYDQQRNLYFDLAGIFQAGSGIVKQRFDLDEAAVKPVSIFDHKGMQKPYSNSWKLALCKNFKNNNDKHNRPQSHIIHDFGHVLLCSLFLDKGQTADLIREFWQLGVQIYDHHEKKLKAIDETQKAIIKEIISIYKIRLPLKRLKSTDPRTATTLDSLSELSRCPRTLFDSLSAKKQQKFRTGDSPLKLSTKNDDNEDSFLLIRGHQNRYIYLMMQFLDHDKDNKLRFAIDLGQFYYNNRLKPASSESFADDHSRVRRLGQKIVAYARLEDFNKLEANKPKSWLQLEANQHEVLEKELTAHTNTSREIQQLKPYIVKTYPHYHYYDDKIGFRIAGNDDTAKYPEWDLAKVQGNNKLDALKGKEQQPHFWISPKQMSHLAFYHLLQTRSENSAFVSLDILLDKKYRLGMHKLIRCLKIGDIPDFNEQTIQDWLDNEIFRNNRGKQFSVMLKDLPRVVVIRLTNNQQPKVTREVLLKRIEHIQDETEKKLKYIQSQFVKEVNKKNNTTKVKLIKKRGKKGFKPIKCGVIADFIVDDLMRFQPIDKTQNYLGSEKLNSQEYQILQAAIAYYGARLELPPRIIDLLRNARLLDGDFRHPFLYKLGLEKNPQKYVGLISFYEDYLAERMRFLQDYKNTIKQKNSVDEELPKWLRLRQNSSLDNWLNEQLDEEGELKQPLPIPRDFFYQPIFSMLSNELGLTEEELLDEGSQTHVWQGSQVTLRPAMSWLIKRYLKEDNDSSQEMYQFERSHRLFNDFKDKRGKKQQFKPKVVHFLSEKKRKDCLPKIRNKVTELTNNKEEADKWKKKLQSYKRMEHRIHQMADQDMLLYLFTKQYLDADLLQLGDNKPDWKLKHIAHTLLDHPIQHELEIQGTKKKLVHTACKVKDLGSFRLLARNKRLPNLLAFYPEDVINQQEVRKELKDYQASKIAIMELSQALENKIINKFGQVKTINQGGKEVPTSHSKYLDVFFEQVQPDDINKEQLEQVRKIRNAFAHNDYPESDAFPEIAKTVQAQDEPDNPDNNRKVSMLFQEALESIHRSWNRLLH